MQLIIFDCDGTLVDSQHGIVAAMNHAFATVGLPPPTRAATLSGVGLSLPEAFARLVPEQPLAVQQALARIYKSDFQVVLARTECPEPLYPGIATLIAALADRNDVRLGMATGKSQRGVARVLAREGWHGAFVTIQTADENPSKPHPGMIAAAMREAGIGPAATVMIGDTTYDIDMARNAGVAGIGVAWGYHDVARLAGAGARHIVQASSELPAAIATELGARERK